jgi:hypothetical protein
MKIIKSNGRDILIDDEDFELLKQFVWYITPAGYVQTNQLLHRMVMGLKAEGQFDQKVDHIDRNPLNNQKANLRIVTNQQNRWNMKVKKIAKSGFTGVREDTRPHAMRSKNKWQAYITFNSEFLNLGHYPSKYIAALIRDFWSTYLFDGHAPTNFKVICHSGFRSGSSDRQSPNNNLG